MSLLTKKSISSATFLLLSSSWSSTGKLRTTAFTSVPFVAGHRHYRKTMPFSTAGSFTSRMNNKVCNNNYGDQPQQQQRRGSIYDLQQLIRQSTSKPTSYKVPPKLLSLIDQAAEMELDSTLSQDIYNRVVQEVVPFVLEITKSPPKRGTDNDAKNKMTGEQVYDLDLLDLYDAFVWGFNSPFLWGITIENVQTLYKSNLSVSSGDGKNGNHCEIGVGTGLFLSKDIITSDNAGTGCKSISLIDLNENSLQSCKQRIEGSFNNEDIHKPTVTKTIADIMELPQNKQEDEGDSPLTSLKGKHTSVGANFLFHCLHGSNLHDKRHAFENCASLLSPGSESVFFGSTILGKEMLLDGDTKTEDDNPGVLMLKLFNDSGVFGNLGDSYDDLVFILTDIFEDVVVKQIGYCGLWTAKNPKK